MASISQEKRPFNFRWDVNKYKDRFEPQYWELCKKFMVAHKTKYPEPRLISLTEAFYQIGVYNNRYDEKTTRIVSALAIEVLEDFLYRNPGSIKHPFHCHTNFAIETNNREDPIINKKKAVSQSRYHEQESVILGPSTSTSNKQSRNEDCVIVHDSPPAKLLRVEPPTRSNSALDSPVTGNISVNIIPQEKLQVLFKDFVIFIGVNEASRINRSEVAVDESFSLSKYGQCEWKTEYSGNQPSQLCWRVGLFWQNNLLAEAFGADKAMVQNKLAKEFLNKVGEFAPTIEARQDYYKDGKWTELPRVSAGGSVKIVHRAALKYKKGPVMKSFIDKIALSKKFTPGENYNFTEVVFVFNSSENPNEPRLLCQYVESKWKGILKYRLGIYKKQGSDSNIPLFCVYPLTSLEDLRKWLSENNNISERYRLIPPTAPLSSNTDDVTTCQTFNENTEFLLTIGQKYKKNEVIRENDLRIILKNVVLFYGVQKHDSIINKCPNPEVLLQESFKKSGLESLIIRTEETKPGSWECNIYCCGVLLLKIEGKDRADEAKTVALHELLRKTKSYSFTIEAKEEYFASGRVPPIFSGNDPTKHYIYRVLNLGQNSPEAFFDKAMKYLREFLHEESIAEIVLGPDVPFNIKEHILMYAEKMGYEWRLFSEKPKGNPSHMALFKPVELIKLKAHLLARGGENDIYRLIPPRGPNFQEEPLFKMPLPSVVLEKILSKPKDPGKLTKAQKRIINGKLHRMEARMARKARKELRKEMNVYKANSQKRRPPFQGTTSTVPRIVYENYVNNKPQQTMTRQQDFNFKQHTPIRQLSYKKQQINSFKHPTTTEPTEGNQKQSTGTNKQENMHKELTITKPKEATPTKKQLTYINQENSKQGDTIFKQPTTTKPKEGNSECSAYAKQEDAIFKKPPIPKPKEATTKQLTYRREEEAIFKQPTIANPVQPKTSKPELTSCNQPTSEKKLPEISKPPFSVKESLTSQLVLKGPIPEDLVQCLKTVYVCKMVQQDSSTDTDPCNLLKNTCSLIRNIDFVYYINPTNNGEWHVVVAVKYDNKHVSLGEGRMKTCAAARTMAAQSVVDIIQKHCRIVEPNFSYFAEGGVPDFIKKKYPVKTSTYEILENTEPNKPLTLTDVAIILNMFKEDDDMEDVFFLSSDYSEADRQLLISGAGEFGLSWRLFGPRSVNAKPDQVSTQHLCIYKPKTAMELVKELTTKGGKTDKYFLVSSDRTKTASDKVDSASTINSKNFDNLNIKELKKTTESNEFGSQPNTFTRFSNNSNSKSQKTSHDKEPPSIPVKKSKELSGFMDINSSAPSKAAADLKATELSAEIKNLDKYCPAERKIGGCCNLACNLEHNNIIDSIVNGFLSAWISE